MKYALAEAADVPNTIFEITGETEKSSVQTVDQLNGWSKLFTIKKGGSRG